MTPQRFSHMLYTKNNKKKGSFTELLRAVVTSGRDDVLRARQSPAMSPSKI